MKVVFCIDDNWRFMRLLQVAVRSLRHVAGESVPCLCVYAGENARVLKALAHEGIPVARHAPVLRPETIPVEFHRCIGCFLKLELALTPELADDPYVLYCDADVLFLRSLEALLTKRPAYMAMARENTAPFFHEYDRLDYTWRDRAYTIPMPFPIWTFSSGVALFHLERLRSHDYIHNFLAFCAQNLQRIGNLDQSLLNYFFGKRITRLEERWNRPPYHADAASHGHIIHFHGPKPWEGTNPLWKDLRTACFWPLREAWRDWLAPEERDEVDAWSEEDRLRFGERGA